MSYLSGQDVIQPARQQRQAEPAVTDVVGPALDRKADLLQRACDRLHGPAISPADDGYAPPPQSCKQFGRIARFVGWDKDEVGQRAGRAGVLDLSAKLGQGREHPIKDRGGHSPAPEAMCGGFVRRAGRDICGAHSHQAQQYSPLDKRQGRTGATVSDSPHSRDGV